MSKETYARGFVKAAAERGIDPCALAIMHKEALSLDDIKNAISNAGQAIKNKWDSIDPEYKPLVGGVAGGLLGAGTGAIGGAVTGLGAGRGALAGLGIGGIGGALYGASAAKNGYLAQLEQKDQDHARAIEEEISRQEGIRSDMEEGHKSQLAQERSKHKAELALSSKKLEDISKRLSSANSEIERLNVIRNNLEGFENLPIEQQRAVLNDLSKSREKIDSMAKAVYAKNIVSAFKGDHTPTKAQVKAVNNKRMEDVKRRIDAVKVLNEIRDINARNRAKEEAERQEAIRRRMRESAKGRPVFQLPR